MPTDQNRIKRCINDIKALSQGRNWGEALIFLLFLFVSALFWLLQTLQQVTDVTFSIPITYVNQSNQIAIRDTLPQELQVKVLDKAITLLGYALNKKEQTIEVDLALLTDPKTPYTIPAHYLEAECLKALPSTSKLISYFPAGITVHAIPLKEKKVPVILNGSLVPAKGFMLIDKIKLNPNEVTVYGAKSVLDTLSGIYTEPISRQDMDRTSTFQLALDPPPHIRAVVSEVELNVTIEEYTEKTLELPIVAKGFPKNYKLRTFPPTIQLYCRLPLSQYAIINASHFEAAVFFADAMADSTSMVSVVISQKPDWINDNYRYTPDKVEYLIEQSRGND